MDEVEQRYLIDPSVAASRAQGDGGLRMRSGTAEIMRTAERDPALVRVASEAFARQAVDAATDPEHRGELVTAGTLAGHRAARPRRIPSPPVWLLCEELAPFGAARARRPAP